MKKMLIALTILSSFYATAADRGSNRGVIDIDIDINPNKCSREVRELTKENTRLSEQLRSCQLSGSDRNSDSVVRNLRIKLKDAEDRLENETRRANMIAYHLQEKDNQILDLQARIRTLEDQIYPNPGRFNLAESISACRGIGNASYAADCTQSVKAYSVMADTVSACAKQSNTFYAKECVSSVGENGGSTAQVKACLLIGNAAYFAECVEDASKGKVRSDIIRSCVETSTNTFYQKECVKQMMN